MSVYEYTAISRATSGPTVNPAQAAAIFAVLGTSSAGDLNDAKMFRSDADPARVYGLGPLPEYASIISGYSGQASIGMRMTAATPGTYGTIDLSEFDGTAVPSTDAATVPTNAHELYVIFETGGIVGAAGITYRISVDDGRSTIGGRTSLAAASSISIPHANAKILLKPPADQIAAFITAANELRSARLAHYAEGATVHNSTDASSGTGIGAAAVGEVAAIALVNQVRAADLLHAANATVHNSTGAAQYAACPPAALNVTDAIGLAIYLKNVDTAHNANATIHDTADAGHAITSPSPATGTIVAGDIIRLPTLAPTIDAAAIEDAFEALPAYKRAYGGVVICGRFPVSAWTALINGLDELRRHQRPVIAIIETRFPEVDESPEDYRASLEEEWEGLYDERVYRVSGDGQYRPATLSQARYKSRRHFTAPLAARLAALDFGESPGVIGTSSRALGVPSVFGGPLAGYSIRSDTGALIGVDGFLDGGAATEAGFGAVASVPNKPDTDCYVLNPRMCAPEGNTAPTLPEQRVINAVETVIYIHGTDFVGSRVLNELGRNTIREDAAAQLDGLIYDEVSKVVGDPGRVGSRISEFSFTTDRNADITAEPVTIRWSAMLRTGKYVKKLSGVLAVNGGSA